MNSKEFVLWLKGFTEGVHEFNITPKQWDLLKEKLAEVKDEQSIGIGGWGTPNMAPITPTPLFPPPPPIDPYNPFKVTCSTGSFGTWNPDYAITTTPGTGYITIANPNLVSWATGSQTTNTAQWPITGANVSYTAYQPKNITTEKQSKFKKRKAKSVKEWEDEIDLGGAE
jgi:hypothetical protein